MRTPRPSSETGFTLFEVLVAFAVLAVMMVPLLQVFGGGLGTAETARGYSTAALLARSKLAEVGTEEALEEGETTGSFEGYQWRRRISRTELTAAEADDRDEADESKGSRRRKQQRQSQRFGNRENGMFGDRGGFGGRPGDFGDRDSGRSFFGDRSGGLGGRDSGRSGFGDLRGSFGERGSGFGRSGQSAFPAGPSDRSDQRGTGVGNAREQQSDDLIPYQVTVTVDWGARARGGSLSLSTLRLGRQIAGEAGRR